MHKQIHQGRDRPLSPEQKPAPQGQTPGSNTLQHSIKPSPCQKKKKMGKKSNSQPNHPTHDQHRQHIPSNTTHSLRIRETSKYITPWTCLSQKKNTNMTFNITSSNLTCECRADICQQIIFYPLKYLSQNYTKQGCYKILL